MTWADLPLPRTQLSEASTRSPQWASLGHTSVVNFEPLGTLGLRVWTLTDTPSPHPLWHWQVCAQRAGEAQVSPNPALRAPVPRNNLPLAFPPLPSLIWPVSLGWHCPLVAVRLTATDTFTFSRSGASAQSPREKRNLHTPRGSTGSPRLYQGLELGGLDDAAPRGQTTPDSHSPHLM